MADSTPEIDVVIETDHVKMNPWQPEQNKIRLALLGKLGEELGEGSAIVSRCIIQGIDEVEPRTQKPNRLALLEELADITAAIAILRIRFRLDPFEFERRVSRKMRHLGEWHSMITGDTDV